MSKEYKLLKEAFDSIKKKIPYEPEVAITLGSGLGGFVDSLKQDAVISYSDVKNFPKTTNAAHSGKFIFAKINGVKTVVMQGRIHSYEGYSTMECVRPVRLVKMMGAKVLVLTNAAGGINKKFKPGDLMMLTDQISSFVKNPLVGENVEELGERFPDMTNCYDLELRKQIKAAAKKCKIDLKEGVYLQTQGPSYETAIEVKAFMAMGASAVGMSVTIETIAARHCGLRVAGISVITNLGTGLTKDLQSDDDVVKTANKAGNKLAKLIKTIITPKFVK